MTLNLQEILRTLRLWMMGNSSSLHLAIIYMDLSLFVCQLFGHAVSSSLWHKYSAEVKKKKKNTQFLQPSDAEAFSGKQTNVSFPVV